MRIERILNSNVVLSRNEQGGETVYVGRDLAFQKKIGDTINPDYAEKEFVSRDSIMAGQFRQLLEDVPTKEIEVAERIVDLAETTLTIKLPSNIHSISTDHVHYVLLRARERIDIPDPLAFETRRFYPKEFEVTRQALMVIAEELGVQFSENEAGFTTSRIMNTEQGSDNIEVTMETTRIVRDILTVISRYFGQVPDEDLLSYQ